MIHKKYYLLSILFSLVFVVSAHAADALKLDKMVKSADGSEIHYNQMGAGDTTIVFVHCWTCDSQLWQAQVDYFSKNYQVAWLNLAGHGTSGTQRQQYTMEAFAQDVEAVVNAIQAEKVILVGHSMGGSVIVAAAEILGNKVVDMVAVDSFYNVFNYSKTNDEIEAYVQPFVDDFKEASHVMANSMFMPNANPELKIHVLNHFSQVESNVGISALREIFKWNVKHNPNFTLLENYAQQNKLHHINAASMSKGEPANNTVIQIADVGHFVAQMKPDEFNRALEKIITREK